MSLLPDLSDLIGIPYIPHGRDEKGIDCFGLIWLITLRLGKPIPDVPYKGFDPAHMKLADQMKVNKIEKREIGCVIEMLKDGRLHLGFAVDDKTMIHSTTNEGVIIDPIGKYPVMGYWKFD